MINNILNLFYPPICGFCGRISKDNICRKCLIKIKKYDISSNKYEYPNMYFDEIFHIFKYEGDIRNRIIKYKFKNAPYLYKTFSKLILNNEKICDILKKYDLIIPVPIHKKRKLIRGYNQTELIARDLANNLDLKLEKNILIKEINTKAQSESNKMERQTNIIDAFKIQNLQKIKNKNVLIFDDIYTTGSTANECAKVLKKAQAKKVGVFTIAKDYIK